MNPARAAFAVFVVCCLVTPLAAQQAAPAGGNERVAAIKQSLQASMQALRGYEWVETTTISVKGEEKSRKQESCRYGADGKVEKTPIGGAPEEGGKKPRGLRGRIVEKKKSEISESMQEAIGLVKQYIPPDPARIDAAKEAGNLSVTPPDENGMASLVIKNYLKQGDSVTIELNAAANRFSGMAVSTFTDKAKDAVNLKVSMGTLVDGTIYPETIQLDVAKENLGVQIENAGYEKLGG